MLFTGLEKIESIELVDTPEKIPIITEKNISDIVLDFELSDFQLLRAIEFYYETKGEETLELINRLLSLYNVTMSFKIFQYIKGICLIEKLPLVMRLYLSKEICGYKHDESCYSILGNLCNVMKQHKVCTTSRVEYITVLFKSSEQYDLALSLFSDIIDDLTLENKYRFSLIKQLSTEPLQNHFYLRFLSNRNNEGVYRVLSGQTIIIKNYELQVVQQLLHELSEDKTQEYNLRADATDVLLRYGDEKYKAIAKDTIETLGGVTGKPTTIYENAQNAHTSSIEESAVSILSTLYSEPLYKTTEGRPIDFEFVQANILERIGENKTITAVLNRINLDVAQYSKLHITLKTALILVYSFILSRNEDDLFKNLIAELTESHGICSTGIMERIANTLSGYDDFMVSISFEDQIKGNLHGRLNARIKNIDKIPCIHSKLCDCIETSCYASKTTGPRDGKCGSCATCQKKECIHVCDGDKCGWNLEFQSKALMEMTIPSRKPKERVNFLRVYRLYISDIMEEMKKEFDGYIDLTSFDLYFRKAMMDYDCA